MTKKALNDLMLSLADAFIDSIIDFGVFKIYLTNCDIFLNNHFAIDDCAYIKKADSIYSTPTAIIKENSYLGSTTYYELSINYGFIEFLFTGGFYVTDNSSYLLLGSSLGAWKHGELLSKEIYILNDITKIIYTSPRLLNQYS